MEGMTRLLESDKMLQKAHRAYVNFARDTSLVAQYGARFKQNLDQSDRKDSTREGRKGTSR